MSIAINKNILFSQNWVRFKEPELLFGHTSTDVSYFARDGIQDKKKK